MAKPIKEPMPKPIPTPTYFVLKLNINLLKFNITESNYYFIKGFSLEFRGIF